MNLRKGRIEQGRSFHFQVPLSADQITTPSVSSQANRLAVEAVDRAADFDVFAVNANSSTESHLVDRLGKVDIDSQTSASR